MSLNDDMFTKPCVVSFKLVKFTTLGRTAIKTNHTCIHLSCYTTVSCTLYIFMKLEKECMGTIV